MPGVFNWLRTLRALFLNFFDYLGGLTIPVCVFYVSLLMLVNIAHLFWRNIFHWTRIHYVLFLKLFLDYSGWVIIPGSVINLRLLLFVNFTHLFTSLLIFTDLLHAFFCRCFQVYTRTITFCFVAVFKYLRGPAPWHACVWPPPFILC